MFSVIIISGNIERLSTSIFPGSLLSLIFITKRLPKELLITTKGCIPNVIQSVCVPLINRVRDPYCKLPTEIFPNFQI